MVVIITQTTAIPPLSPNFHMNINLNQKRRTTTVTLTKTLMYKDHKGSIYVTDVLIRRGALSSKDMRRYLVPQHLEEIIGYVTSRNLVQIYMKHPTTLSATIKTVNISITREILRQNEGVTVLVILAGKVTTMKAPKKLLPTERGLRLMPKDIVGNIIATQILTRNLVHLEVPRDIEEKKIRLTVRSSPAI